MIFFPRSKCELRETLSYCECGAKGELTDRLIDKLWDLEEAMGERLAFGRGYVCRKCSTANEGYGDSGHPLGVDVDVCVYGQYFRHKILQHVTRIFPVVTLGPRVFHLSVRKDWPQMMATIY